MRLKGKENDLKKKFDELKNERSKLNKKEKETKKLEYKLKKEREKVKKIKEQKENLSKLNKELKQVENKLKEKSDILLGIPKKEKEIYTKDANLLRKESEIEEIGYEMKNKLFEIKKEQKLEEKKIENRFHNHLKKSLLKPTEIFQEEKPKEHTHNEVYVLIDHCRNLIDLKEIDEAKLLYNQIREKFIELGIEGIEKGIKSFYWRIKIS